jgi:hypothetical protein
MGRERDGDKSRWFQRDRLGLAFEAGSESLLAVQPLAKGVQRDLAEATELGVRQAATLKVIDEATPAEIGRGL